MNEKCSFNGDWGLGIGDWGLGLGIGPNPQSPIPHPQSPIPKKENFNKFLFKLVLLNINYLLNNF